MYLKKFTIQNIKCFSNLTLDFAPGGHPRKWTAILGKNGIGKSTLMQAIGVTLAGPVAIRELMPVADGWVRSNANYGLIESEILWTEGDAQTPHWPKTKTPYLARYVVTGQGDGDLPASLSEYRDMPPIVMDWSGEGSSKAREKVTKDMIRLKQTAYSENKKGWFSCGYGPFRRLSGGAQQADRILYSERKASRFITLFREDAALTNATDWLISLYNTGRDGDVANQYTLDQVKEALKSDLLPESCDLVVNSNSALLKVAGRSPVLFRDLSDGYRSMLALGVDLLRRASSSFPEAENLLSVAGVVLIDEIDAHAHPEWQRQIGHWLRTKFPNLQFIVTTHSPFIAQVADEQGGNIILEQRDGVISTRDDVESVEGWRADQILTDLQDLKSTRSPEAEKKLRRYQELRERQTKLPLAEQSELKQLRLWVEKLPAPYESADERVQSKQLETQVEKIKDKLEDLQ